MAGLRRTDVLLASFPRSGSTFLRFLLTHYALERQGDVSAVSFDRLNELAPELGVSPLFRSRPMQSLPRVVKTHRPYSRLLARPRAALLVRAPLDALASYHRYWTARRGTADPGRSAFLRDERRGLPRWITHTRSWQGRVGHTIRYADLRTDPVATVTDLLSVLGVSVDGAALGRAVERSAVDRIRSVSEHGVGGSDAFEAGAVFVSDQPAGSGRAYFDAADVGWARSRLQESGLATWSDEI